MLIRPFTLLTLLLSLLTLAAAPPQRAHAASGTTLARSGQALHPVVVHPQASERVKAAAEDLAQMLSRISGATFELIESNDPAAGVVVAAMDQQADWSAPLPLTADPDSPETYLLRTHQGGMWIIGATDLAVEHAVSDTLYELGHRQYFPRPTWEIVPKLAHVQLAIDRRETPDYVQRTYGIGHGLRRENRPATDLWAQRNRFRSAVSISSGHAYGAILRRNREAFEQHPEYLGLVDGERKSSKFCISNPGLRQLVVDYAISQFQQDPELQSISMEPSDGGSWCQCQPCQDMGSISDRVVILANQVAAAINELGLGTKYVGMLAYHMHSIPPSVEIHPNVVVRAATNAVRGGYTHEQIIAEWAKRGATMGVSDFYDISVSTFSMPARQKGSDLPRIAQSIARWHELGVRHINLSLSDTSGAIGLGRYLAARILWDVREADRVEALFDDFIHQCFGPAAEPMDRFFRLLYRVEPDDMRPRIPTDMIGRMYRLIAQARTLTSDTDIHQRLNDLLLYTRYVDLYHTYREATGRDRQKAAQAALLHAYRISDTQMVNTRMLLNHLLRRDNQLEAVPQEQFLTTDEPYTPAELDAMLQAGIENYDIVEIGFQPISFSDDLVPASPLNLPEVAPGNFGGAPVGRHSYYLWLDQPGDIRLHASGGHIQHYRHLAGAANIQLFSRDNPVEEAMAVEDSQILPDGEVREIRLPSEYAHLHHIEAWQNANRVRVEPAEPGQFFTAESSFENSNNFSGSWTLYFYVPRGTKVVGGFASTRGGSLHDGDGQTVLRFNDIETPGYFHVDVPAGQDGKLWKLDRVRGRRLLMTVPPYLARSGEELLLPREVVEADRP